MAATGVEFAPSLGPPNRDGLRLSNKREPLLREPWGRHPARRQFATIAFTLRSDSARGGAKGGALPLIKHPRRFNGHIPVFTRTVSSLRSEDKREAIRVLDFVRSGDSTVAHDFATTNVHGAPLSKYFLNYRWGRPVPLMLSSPLAMINCGPASASAGKNGSIPSGSYCQGA